MMKGILGALLLTASAAGAQDIGGRYALVGEDFNGGTYVGSVTITATSDVTCEIRWLIAGDEAVGICMRQDNAFAASYVMNGNVGMVIYRVLKDGTLQGTWTVAGSNGVGKETLKPM